MNRPETMAATGYHGAMEPDITSPAVVLVHHEVDSTAAITLAAALRTTYGIEVWVRGWEVIPGDSTVEKIDDGLTRARGGLLMLSGQALVGWDKAQYEALVARAAQRGREGAFMMPVLLDAAIEVPPLLATWAALPSHDIAGIARAILKHAGIDVGDAPALGKLLRPPPTVALELVLHRDGFHVVARLGEVEHRSFMPVEEAREVRGKLRGSGVTRDPRAATGTHPLVDIGRRLADVLAGPVGAALASALDPRADRGQAVLRLRSEDPDLLALPWEAALVVDLGPLALIARTTVLRVSPSAAKYRPAEVPGPLRILVAVAAPADDLDIEHERAFILNALEDHEREDCQRQRALGRLRVVFIDESLATLEAIRQQLDAEPFHVLHISAHGGPGLLLFEDADGKPAPTEPAELARVLLEANHPPPLVVLSACSSATPGDDVDRLHAAQVLLDAGVPAVIAMQGPVGDGYATELARRLYRRLALSGAPAPARALADARRDVERARLEHARTDKFFAASAPEYGTPVIYTIDMIGDLALYDHTRPWQSVPEPPTLIQVPGMPARPLGWIVGQRSLARRLRRTLTTRRSAGAVLTGMGGLGKSSLAASVLTQLVREGWGVVAIVGVFALADLAREFVLQLGEQQMSGRLTEKGRGWIAALRDRNADDDALITALRGLLADDPIIILLDNFELNLVSQADGLPAALRDGASQPATIRVGMQQVMERLVSACDRGALLVTCRYPLDGLNALVQWPLPPLNSGAMRRLLLRLEGLRALSAAELEEVQATLGPHPRVLEFADALVRAEQGAWQEVFGDIRAKMTNLSRRRGDEPLEDVAIGETSERLAVARRLAAEDVLLDALLTTLDDETRRFLFAVAVFRRGVPGDALDAVARAVGLEENERWRKQAVRVLQDRTLIAEAGPGVRIEAAGPRTWKQSWMVHRWTASELHTREPAPAAAHSAAADWWLVPKKLAWDDAVEGVEHLLAAGRFEDASELGFQRHQHAASYGENFAALSLGERLLEGLPPEGVAYANWLSTTAELIAQIGGTSEAEQRLREAIRLFKGHSTSSPNDLSTLRDLARSYDRLGDLYRAQGNTDPAEHFYNDAHLIRMRLADASPGRSDFQRDLSVSFSKLGDLYLAMGKGELAGPFFEKDLQIAKRLAEAEPDSVDLQRDLAVSYEKLGNLNRDAMKVKRALRFFEAALDIRKRLVVRQPDRVDLQRDLSVSCNKLGQLNLAIDDPEAARGFYEQNFAIANRLAGAEPARSDLQRDLANSYQGLAGVNPENASYLLSAAVNIRRQRVAAEPGNVIVHCELAMTLFQQAECVDSRGALDLIRECYVLLRNLYQHGALEPKYHGLLASLGAAFRDAAPLREV